MCRAKKRGGGEQVSVLMLTVLQEHVRVVFTSVSVLIAQLPHTAVQNNESKFNTHELKV